MSRSLSLLALIVTFLFAQCFTVQAADSFWNAYRAQLFSFLKGGQASKGMQIITTPFVAMYDINPEEQSLSDLLNPVSKSGEIRDVSPQSDSLPLQYYDFISNLKVRPMDPKLEDRIEQQKQSVEAIMQVIATEEPKCRAKYDQYAQYGIAQGTFEQFIQQWCHRLSASLTEVAMGEMELKRLASSATDQDIRNALARFEKALKDETFAWKETLTTSLAYFRQKIEKNQLNAFHISISKSELRNQETQTEWSSTNEEPFIKNAKGKSFSLSSSNDKFNMDIKAAGYVAVNVAPDQWYSQEVIDNHRSGPFKDSSLARDFFGKDKKLSMLPTKLYMVYKPEIIIQVGSEDVEYFCTTPKVKIGPFSGIVASISEIVGGSNSDMVEEEEEPLPEKDTKVTKVYRVVVRDEREDPLIVAVDNKML